MTVSGDGRNGVGPMAVVAVSEPKASTSVPAVQPVAPSGAQPTVGLILPPPDLRAIVDKTAQFIAKNGEQFEARILTNERGSNKFNFLLPSDPYQAYYRTKIDEFRGVGVASSEGAAASVGPSTSAPKPQAPAIVVKQDDQVKKSVVVEQVLEPPAPEDFTVRIPPGMTALDLDVVRLAAQFVARNGKEFLAGLASREQDNPQFSFLKPTHSLHAFFTSLTDAYAKVLRPSQKAMDALTKDADDLPGILERCLQRLEWMRVQEEEKKAREDEVEKERVAMALIDWHDFSIVETIEFPEGQDAQLPEPFTEAELAAMSKAEPAAVEEGEEAAMEMEMDEDIDMDEDEADLIAQGAAEEAKTAASAGTGVAVGAGVGPAPGPAPEPAMKIVKNYKRLSQLEQSKGAASTRPENVVVSPITGELVPIDEMAEHMRISLIDPKWREQKDAMLAKIKDSTKASDEEVARNVSSLASTRPDIFGSTEEEISKIVAAEIARSKKAATFTEDRRAEGERAAASSRTAAGPQLPPQRQPRDPPPRPQPHAPPQRPWLPPPFPVPPGGVPIGAPIIVPGPGFAPLPPGAAFPPPYPAMPRPPVPPPFQAAPPAAPPSGRPPPRETHPAESKEAVPRKEASGSASAEVREVKRPRVEEESTVMKPEQEWLASHPGPVTVRVQLPTVSGSDVLDGRRIDVSIAEGLACKVDELKRLLAERTKLAANKQKLRLPSGVFIQGHHSLAHYNVAEDTVIDLGVKARGGRKK